jgi:hypothetical protein
MFMGATLPVLVTYLNRQFKQLGRSLGWLYFVNTLGSAIACFVTTDVLFVVTGLTGAIRVAAICNFAVGALVIVYARALERQRSSPTASVAVGAHA